MQCGTFVTRAGSSKMYDLIISKPDFFKHAKGRYMPR